MKKLLIILMVVAMASFLFVGCTTGVAPPANGDEDEDEVVGPATDAPIITEITGVLAYDLTAATNYINIADVLVPVTVDGVGPVNSIIKIYVNDVWAGTGATGWTGVFGPVTLTAANLGTTDESKVITAKAKQSGLAESAASTAYTFTQDTAAPKIASAVADSTDQTVTVTFNEAVDTTAAGTVAGTRDDSALTVANWFIGGTQLTIANGDTVTKVSSTVVRLNVLNTTGAAVVPIAGDGFYVTCAFEVEDLAGNPNTADITGSGTVGD